MNPARISFNWGSGSPRRHQGKENSTAAGRPGQRAEKQQSSTGGGGSARERPQGQGGAPGEGRVGPEQRSSGASGRVARAPWRRRERVRTGIWEAARGKAGGGGCGHWEARAAPLSLHPEGLESLPHGCTEARGEAQSVPERALSHLHKPEEPVTRTQLKPHHCGSREPPASHAGITLC